MLLSMFADVRAQCYVVLSNALYTKAHALCWPPLVCCSLEIRVSCLKTGAVTGKCKKNVSIRPHWATNLDVERGLDRDVMVVWWVSPLFHTSSPMTVTRTFSLPYWKGNVRTAACHLICADVSRSCSLLFAFHSFLISVHVCGRRNTCLIAGYAVKNTLAHDVKDEPDEVKSSDGRMLKRKIRVKSVSFAVCECTISERHPVYTAYMQCPLDSPNNFTEC